MDPVRDVSEPELFHESCVLVNKKGLCEVIGRHRIGVDPADIDILVAHLLAQPVVVNVDMAEASTDWFILNHCAHGLTVITVDGERALLRVKFNSFKQSDPPEELFAASVRASSSASVDERVTVFCFFADQSIGPLKCINRYTPELRRSWSGRLRSALHPRSNFSYNKSLGSPFCRGRE